MGPAPMDGLRVIDFSTTVAGPWATRLMADCGAEVIKIEAAGDGDVLRHTPPVAGGLSPVLAPCNPAQNNVALELKSAEGLAAARRATHRRQVAGEDFLPGRLDRVGPAP